MPACAFFAKKRRKDVRIAAGLIAVDVAWAHGGKSGGVTLHGGLVTRGWMHRANKGERGWCQLGVHEGCNGALMVLDRAHERALRVL